MGNALERAFSPPTYKNIEFCFSLEVNYTNVCRCTTLSTSSNISWHHFLTWFSFHLSALNSTILAGDLLSLNDDLVGFEYNKSLLLLLLSAFLFNGSAQYASSFKDASRCCRKWTRFLSHKDSLSPLKNYSMKNFSSLTILNRITLRYSLFACNDADIPEACL